MDIASIAVGAVGAGFLLFFTGFFQKLGEDIYRKLLQKYVNPPDEVGEKAQVIVQFQPLAPQQLANVDAPPVEVERRTNITADQIHAEIDNAPLLQQQEVANRYVGLAVEWDVYLRYAGEMVEGSVILMLSVKPDGMAVAKCRVSAHEYPALKILKSGAPLRIAGTIAGVDIGQIVLANPRLEIAV